MNTTITTEIARIDELENDRTSQSEDADNAAESVTTDSDTQADAQSEIADEISVSDSAESIMPDADLLPPGTVATLPEDKSVDPDHALIASDPAIARSAESVMLDDSSVTNSMDPIGGESETVTDSLVESWRSIQLNTQTFFENALAATPAFFKQNQRSLTVLGVIFLTIISVKLLFAGLDAIDDIPLVAPLLKVTGLFYLARFVWRYLLRERDRQELIQKIEHTKTEVLGN